MPCHTAFILSLSNFDVLLLAVMYLYAPSVLLHDLALAFQCNAMSSIDSDCISISIGWFGCGLNTRRQYALLPLASMCYGKHT